MRSLGAQLGQLIERVDPGAVAVGGKDKRHGVAANQSGVGDGDGLGAFNHQAGLLDAVGFPAAGTLARRTQGRRRDLDRRPVVPRHDQLGAVLYFDSLRNFHKTTGYRLADSKETTA